MNVKPGQKARVVFAERYAYGQENNGIVVMVDRLAAPGEGTAVRVKDPGALWHVTSISRPFQLFKIRQEGRYTICKRDGELWDTTVPDKFLQPINDDEEDAMPRIADLELTQ